MKKSRLKNLKIYWAWYLVLIFIIVRFLINMEMTALSIFFAIVYAIFFIMLIMKVSYFITLFIIFLAIDSMIGTYLASTKLGFDYIYWGTMAVNLIIIFILIRNINNNFEK